MVGAHSIKGTLHIDGNIAPLGIQIKIDFGADGEETTTTYEYNIYGDNTNYNRGFWNREGQTGYFYIFHNGEWTQPYNIQSILITDQIGHFIDLYIGEPPTGDLCTWITDKGGPTSLVITDIFEIVDSYLFSTSPTGYSFIPTLQNVFGVVDYYLGFNGDPLTGCIYFT